MGSPNTDPAKKAASARRWYEKNDGAAYGRALNTFARDQVIEGYGRVCQCCGESESSFLTVDHVNNDGAADRKVKKSGRNFYYWLIRNNFPAEYQLFCQNCNASKARLGKCAHILKKLI